MKLCITLSLSLCCFSLFGQQLNFKDLSLEDMSAFKTQAGNWFVAGDVMMNPAIDIHEKHEPPPPPPVAAEPAMTKKKKKKDKQEVAVPAPPPPPPLPPMPKAVTFKEGKGILLNMNDDKVRDNLLTNWEHGDIILDLDVMIPKGSNSGIYLQGRYEVQLLDSWGVKDPSFSDIGGIYRNWETQKGNIYMGKAPLTNAAKAPGTWQHFTIGFKAPRFDQNGKKIENARFVFVDLNGIRIHENVEVPLPTGGPIDKNEAALGPLMIQGDHGPVAFKNIRYKLLQEQPLTLENLDYDIFEGPIMNLDALKDMKPIHQSKIRQLTAQLPGSPESFVAFYKGKLVAPAKGSYDLRLNYEGGLKLTINNKDVLNDRYSWYAEKMVTVNLEAGENDFDLAYNKVETWRSARLGVFNVTSFPVPLHSISSYPPSPSSASPILVQVGQQPKLLRAFLDFNGDRKQRLTHSIGVGVPSGVNFVYDLKAGSIACVWRGDFVDATPMWFDRGDGSFRPRGAVQFLYKGHSYGKLAEENSPFPENLDEKQGFQNMGYSVDKATGLPIFKYKVGGMELEDFIAPDPSGNALKRKIFITKGQVAENFFLKLAQGQQIEALPNHVFVVDRSYYIEPSEGLEIKIRTINGQQELVVKLSEKPAAYTINW